MKSPVNYLFFLLFFFAFNNCKKEDTNPVEVKYFPTVKSIIEANCTISCHAPSKGFHEGMPVILETDEEISSGAYAIKRAVADSITFFNKRMPLDTMLSQSNIDIIVKWYNKGGKTTD